MAALRRDALRAEIRFEAIAGRRGYHLLVYSRSSAVFTRWGGNAAGRSSAAEEACRNLDRESAPTAAFEPSLFVWATVMSRPAEDRAIVDAGLKALAFDSGPPLVCDEPAATYERASDEHGRLAVTGATNRLRIGDKIRLVPGHCDPTVNLYDWYVAIRANRVEQLWPITARGAVY